MPALLSAPRRRLFAAVQPLAGVGQVYELTGTSLDLHLEVEPAHLLKCGKIGSLGAARHLATGDAKGTLHLWSMEDSVNSTASCAAHDGIINHLAFYSDAEENGSGTSELATAGGDGCVKLWDARALGKPVGCFQPKSSCSTHGNGSSQASSNECWAVAYGNAHNQADRCLLAGYSSGELKLFDLRTGSQRWQNNLGSGVVAVEFDRYDIEMNKFTAACMSSILYVFDARTQHTTKVTSVTEADAPAWPGWAL